MLEDPIARRYFVMNFFDGIMTAFGIVVGGAAAIGSAPALIKAGIGASLAIMVSGFFGAYMVEKTERRLELKELEKHIMKSLKGTALDEKAKRKTLELALIDAISPFLGAVIPILPFFATVMGLISYESAILASLLISLLLLIFLGGYLGKLLKENPWKNALAFAAGGLVIGILSSALETLI
jgi:predicted membrane protein (TIGR00267 family)